MSPSIFSETFEKQLEAEADRQQCDVETLLHRRLGDTFQDDELSQFFTLSLDIICIAQDGMMVRVNPAFVRILGYDEATLLSTPYRDLIHPDDRDNTEATVEEGLGGKLILHFENRYIAKDGRVVWLSWMAIPDAAGTRLFAIGRDISDKKRFAEIEEQKKAQNSLMLEASVAERTKELSETVQRLREEIQRREAVEAEKKQSEASLKVSEDRFRGAFEFSPIGMSLVSPEGKWLRANKSMTDILGYSQDELLRIDFQTITYPDDLQDDLDMLHSVLRGDTDHFQMRKRYYHKNGKVVWALLAVSLVRTAEGAPSYFVSQIYDITEQKRAEEALLNANEEMQRFAYIMSHDLRAPLINLRGFSDILRKSVDDVAELSDTMKSCLDDDQQKTLEEALTDRMPVALKFIGTSVDRMDQYTAAILRLSRVGRRQLNYEKVCARGVVERILQSLAVQINEQDIEVEIEALPLVYADRLALDQILANIIINAVKYLDPARPGRIQIFSETLATEIVFHVRDNGRGITESDQGRIFEPFHRVDSQTVEGEGMGLAYVQALVKRQGGRIWFTSSPGVGSTFSVALPILQENMTDGGEAHAEACEST